MNSLLYYYTMQQQQQQPRRYDGIKQFRTLYDVGVCLRPTICLLLLTLMAAPYENIPAYIILLQNT